MMGEGGLLGRWWVWRRAGRGGEDREARMGFVGCLCRVEGNWRQ